jgi:hypothetical protein
VCNIVRLSHKHDFICTPASMGFVVDKVALGQIFHCQYHSINDPYSFTHLSPARYNLNNWVSLNTTLFHPCRLEMFNFVEEVNAFKWFSWFLASAAMYMRSAIIWDFTKRRRFGPTHRTHHQGSASSGNSMPTCCNLSVATWLIGCPETSVRNYNATPREIAEKGGSPVLCSFCQSFEFVSNTLVYY